MTNQDVIDLAHQRAAQGEDHVAIATDFNVQGVQWDGERMKWNAREVRRLIEDGAVSAPSVRVATTATRPGYGFIVGLVWLLVLLGFAAIFGGILLGLDFSDEAEKTGTSDADAVMWAWAIAGVVQAAFYWALAGVLTLLRDIARK